MLTVQKPCIAQSTRVGRVPTSSIRSVAHVPRSGEVRGLARYRVVSAVRCAAQETDKMEVSSVAQETVRPVESSSGWSKTVALFAAAVLLTSVGQVDEAMAARSGGRVGGSSFSSARMRSGGVRSAPSVSSGGVRNYNYYSAPPLISPYGGYGMFGGGLVMPFPVFGLGGLFNIMVLLFMVNVAVSVVQGLTNGRDGRGKEDRWEDDGEDDRW